jgi:sulfite exporter TauE/SafE
LNLILKNYKIPALTSFIFGGFLLILGICNLSGKELPGMRQLSKSFSKSTQNLSLLMLQDKPWPAFLFGFMTVLLPCGQTVIVFSACALFGDPLAGFANGLALAVLTAPGLAAAMHAHHFFHKLGRHYHLIVGFCACLVGLLAVLRGCADLGLISHLVLNPASPAYYHVVIF